MDLQKILNDLKNCPCGKEHTMATKVVEIASGATARVGQILTDANFPKKLLLVADENTLGVSAGLLESLNDAGFETKKIIYKNMMYAKIEQVREVEALCADVDAIIRSLRTVQ